MDYVISHFGIFLFCGLIVVYSLLSSTIKNKHLSIYFFIFLAIICIFSYYFDPFPSKCDLSRHFITMQRMQNITFNNFLNLLEKENLKGSLILFYAISKTDNFSLLPVISAIIVYGNLFYILNLEIKKNKIEGLMKSSIILFSVICLNFIATISGIRNYIGLAIFAAATYYDFNTNLNKIFIWIMYFMSLFFHESLMALLLIRVIFILFNKKNPRIFFIFASLIVFFFVMNIDYFSEIMKGDYATTLFEKYGYYEDYGTGRDIMVFAIMLNTLLVLIQLLSVHKFKEIFSDKYLLYIFFLVCFELLMPFISYQIFTRFFNYLLVISIPINVKFFKKLYSRDRGFLNAIIKISLFILMGIVYVCYGYSNYTF